ncbi:hypothetical protein F4820DRAFT_443855 [Hypoxylon rubiginosum]|uniref:Uncharacterized protein n=1 Tax=Hypoxylon rubiginosum TaxID=110542 RepID=A0ACB9ZEH3_9PEZI|nr:hypothetical protein F4820DRAFT_443855 [Hypoxylon rubiginosum]
MSPMLGLRSLPPELRALILESLASPADLFSLITTSKQYYDTFLRIPEHILAHVIRNAFGTNLQHALGAFYASRQTQETERTREVVESLLDDYHNDRLELPTSLADLSQLSRMFVTIQRLILDYSVRSTELLTGKAHRPPKDQNVNYQEIPPKKKVSTEELTTNTSRSGRSVSPENEPHAETTKISIHLSNDMSSNDKDVEKEVAPSEISDLAFLGLDLFSPSSMSWHVDTLSRISSKGLLFMTDFLLGDKVTRRARFTESRSLHGDFLHEALQALTQHDATRRQPTPECDFDGTERSDRYNYGWFLLSTRMYELNFLTPFSERLSKRDLGYVLWDAARLRNDSLKLSSVFPEWERRTAEERLKDVYLPFPLFLTIVKKIPLACYGGKTEIFPR